MGDITTILPILGSAAVWVGATFIRNESKKPKDLRRILAAFGICMAMIGAYLAFLTSIDPLYSIAATLYFEFSITATFLLFVFSLSRELMPFIVILTQATIIRFMLGKRSLHGKKNHDAKSG